MNAAVLSFLIFFFVALDSLSKNTETFGDTLDLKPFWYSDAFEDEVCVRVCCGAIYSDYDILVKDSEQSLIWCRATRVGGELRDSCDMSACTDMYLLAWLQRESLSSKIYVGEEPYNERVALVLAQSLNEAGKEWVLLSLSSSYEKNDTVTWKPFWHLSQGYNYSVGSSFLTMKEFKSVPTNAEIYQSLEEWTSANGGFFNYDITTKKNVWKGFEFLFVDGDVREKTWEAVIGEKPTRFFPNGK